jgi:hypothetical protein
VLAEDVIVVVLDRLVHRHAELGAHVEDRRTGRGRDLRGVQARIGRYVQALGDGTAIEEIRTLSALKLREQTLTEELSRVTLPKVRRRSTRRKLRQRLVEWLSLLRQTPAIARQLLRKLLPEPIVLEPLPGGGVRFRGRGAWAAVLVGIVGLVVPPGSFQRSW